MGRVVLPGYIYNQIIAYYKQLLIYNTSVINTTICSLSINSILMNSNGNCSINISNICDKQNDAPNLLDLAINKVINLNNNISTDLRSLYRTTELDCIVQSNLIQSITIQNININCQSKIPVSFEFVNSGNSLSNCILSNLLSSVISNESSIVVEGDFKIFEYVMIGSILLSITIGIGYWIYLNINKRSVIFRKIDYEIEAMV